MTNVKLAGISALLALCTNGYANDVAKPPDSKDSSFSAPSNFMSATGFARWRHFQEAQRWEPEVVEEVVAESPVDGGFDWYGFLIKLEEQVKKHPYARKFVLSWHIDTIGPDWRDDYYLVRIYERDRGVIYDDQHLRYNGVRFNTFALNDELVPVLIAKWREFDERRKKTVNPQTHIQKWFDEDPEKKLVQWWREQSRSRF